MNIVVHSPRTTSVMPLPNAAMLSGALPPYIWNIIMPTNSATSAAFSFRL